MPTENLAEARQALHRFTLAYQPAVPRAAVRQAAGRRCLEMGGVWVDDGIDAKMPVVKIKAQSDAYFRMLQRQPQLREVFQLGNRVAWLTPSGTVLVIDPDAGEQHLSDAAIDRLFEVKR